MSELTLDAQELNKGTLYAREELLGRVFKLDLDVAQGLINRIEGKVYDNPSFEAGVHSYCHKLLGLLGIQNMVPREDTQRDFGIAGMHVRLQAAYDLAKAAHTGQTRKVTGLDYFEHHVVQVAKAVSNYVMIHNPSVDQVITVRQANMVCAALLHDVVEDTNVTLQQIESEFGEQVAQWVDGLTHVTVGVNRADREYKTQQKLIAAAWEVRLIKCFDIMHNAKDLAQLDPNFGVTWFKEKLDLFEGTAFLEGIPPIVAESLRTTVTLGYELSQALSAKK